MVSRARFLVVAALAAGDVTGKPATARIGGLFPMFLSESAGYGRSLSGVRRFAAFRLALSEINNKTDGIADDLLPDTQLLYAHRDSKCKDRWGIYGAVQLTQNTFGGQGVHAIVGAACSDASLSAAFLGTRLKVPQVSYSSTSGELSDGSKYPYFARTPPSDAFQAFALASLVKYQFGYNIVATVATTDKYGIAGINAFHAAAEQMGILVLAKELLDVEGQDFASQYTNIKASQARVIILFCLGAGHAGRFLLGAHEHGIGGPGYMFIGSDGTTRSDIWETNEMNSNETLRLAIMKGFFGVKPFVDAMAEAYAGFEARMRAQPTTKGTGTECDMETDDDGGQLVWAADHDDDPLTPMECAGTDNQIIDTYQAYTYDAVFAIAHALHELIEVRGRSEIDADELMTALLDNVSFAGATGRVDFDSAMETHGDRNSDIAYNVWNYQSVEAGLVKVGKWSPQGLSWEQEWKQLADFVYSTTDNTMPVATGPVEIDVKVPILQRMSDDRVLSAAECEGSWVNDTCWLSSSWQAVAVAGLAAVQDFNARRGTYTPAFASDSVLACDKKLQVELLDSSSIGPTSSQRLADALPIDALIGPARSASTSITANIAGMLDVPQISYLATSTALDDLTEYPRFMRTIPNDKATAAALCDFWSFLGFENAALLYMNDLYGKTFDSELTSSCSAKGVTLQSFGFTPMDEASIDSAVALLDEAAIGVVGVLSIGATDLRHITEAALALGLLGHGTRACWWFAESQLSAFQVLPQAAQQALHGSHYLNGYGGGTDASPSFSSFVDNWPNRRPNDYNDMLPAGWKLPADFFFTESATSGTMRFGGSFEYDAVAAIGLLACQVSPTGPLPEDFGTLVWEAKEQLTFEGLSGTVRFDAIGNRGAGGALMNNLLLDESDGSWREVLVATVREGEWEWVGGSLEDSGAVFGNNGAELPKEDLSGGLSGSSEVSLSVIVAVTAVAFMLLLIAGVAWRRYWRASHDTFRLKATGKPPVLPKLERSSWHLFLSHTWVSGQDQVGMIKLRLMHMLRGVRVFRDVDDLKDVSKLEEYIDHSSVVLIFLSQGFFTSRNCLREVMAATRLRKPLVLAHEHDEQKGGAPLEDLRNECPDDLRNATFAPGVEVVRWHRLIDLQNVALKQVAMAMLNSLWSEQESARLPTMSSIFQPGGEHAPHALYLPSCVTEAKIVLSKPVRLYVSTNNSGAARVAEMLLEVAKASAQSSQASYLASGQRSSTAPDSSAENSEASAPGRGLEAASTTSQSSADLTPKFKLKRMRCAGLTACHTLEEATHMVLYLNWDTWEAASQPANEGPPLQLTRQRTDLDITEPAIADEVRRARQMHLPILLVHERAPEHGGCAFDRSSARLECPSWESSGPPPRPLWVTCSASGRSLRP